MLIKMVLFEQHVVVAGIIVNLQNVWKEAGTTSSKMLACVVMVRPTQICDIPKDDSGC
jgi:hypothetical protein